MGGTLAIVTSPNFSKYSLNCSSSMSRGKLRTKSVWLKSSTFFYLFYLMGYSTSSCSTCSSSTIFLDFFYFCFGSATSYSTGSSMMIFLDFFFFIFFYKLIHLKILVSKSFNFLTFILIIRCLKNIKMTYSSLFNSYILRSFSLWI